MKLFVQKNRVSAATLKDLQRIPGVGPSLAQDLVDLGIRKVTALRRRSPERLYQQLCTLRGQQQDKCVLYVFRCAVYFATEQQLQTRRRAICGAEPRCSEATLTTASRLLSPFQRLRVRDGFGRVLDLAVVSRRRGLRSDLWLFGWPRQRSRAWMPHGIHGAPEQLAFRSLHLNFILPKFANGSLDLFAL